MDTNGLVKRVLFKILFFVERQLTDRATIFEICNISINFQYRFTNVKTVNVQTEI